MSIGKMSIGLIAVVYYRTLTSQSSASLTAGYLTAFLRDYGFKVEIYQLEITDKPHDLDQLIAVSPDLIFYKPNFQDVHRLQANLTALEDKLPKTSVGLFGPFAALNAEFLLQKYPSIRGILLPNHEFLAGAAPKWWTGENLEATPEGIFFRKNSEICSHKAASSLIEANAYRLRPARDIEVREPIVIVNLEASRGCLRGCTFCHIPQNGQLSGVPILQRTVDDVVDEMQQLYNLGKRYFIFNDSIMGGGGSPNGLRWLQEFANRLRDEQHEYYFMGYFTLDLLDNNSKLINDLAEAGMIRVFVGVEAATSSALRQFRKSVAVSRYGLIKASLREHFILPHIGFITFHPFAQPADISSGIEFLYANDEIHRFATIREWARLVPGTELMRKATEARLAISDDTQEQPTPHSYKFANSDTQALYERMNVAWEIIGVPLLERLEHLFVTGLFIENLVRRRGLDNEFFIQQAHAFHTNRKRYGKEFVSVMRRLMSSAAEQLFESGVFTEILEETEKCWSELIDAASEVGLESPLRWVTTGDLRSEILRPSDYNGLWNTTRSGKLHH